ncbi:MAG: hypothetical protein LH477_16730 [Nocardioides sp.]|nr:hypothetical protein [Nocardioides sp.]
MRRGWCAAALMWVLVAVAGCGEGRVTGEPSAPVGTGEVEASRAAVQESLRSVVDIATGLGLQVPEASGSWTSCGAEPLRLKYGAGASGTPAGVAGTSTMAEAIATLADALAEAGWTLEGTTTEPRASAVLTQDDLQASLGESRRNPGAVSLGVTGPCLAVAPEQDALLGERDTVLPEPPAPAG